MTVAQHPELYREAAQAMAKHPEWLPKKRKRRPVEKIHNQKAIRGVVDD
ncbi:MAG TPA: hypothetical protein VM822_16965 [Pseudolabrys sp.]|nr:hypothetical protein [Pseudolabrys sp.]